MNFSVCYWCDWCNPNGIKPVLANGLITVFVYGKLTFVNCPRFLKICASDKFIIAEELYAKALQSFETCLSGSNNLCGK